MHSSPVYILLITCTATLCGCETQQSPPASASSFGPPRIMTGNPLDGGFQPTSGLGGYQLPMKAGLGEIGPPSGNTLPGNWHGFGGS